jgi:chromate reductase
LDATHAAVHVQTRDSADYNTVSDINFEFVLSELLAAEICFTINEGRSGKTMDVIGISGSLRKESTNTKALNIALRFAREAGAAVRAVDLGQMAIPIYSEDIPAPPPDLLILQSVLLETDVILIASPEYNHSIPGGLKNVLDWLSVMDNPFDGKVTAIFGVSNGPFGTVRMQPQLRQVLANLGSIVLPKPQICIRNGNEAFTPSEELTDKNTENHLKTLVLKSLKLAEALKMPGIQI